MPLTRILADAAATDAFAVELSLVARAGDVILLEGDLGAGKSSLARSFLRSLLNNPEAEVPSPTFTLLQLYEHARIPAAHADLYRLTCLEEVFELGLGDLAFDHVLLIEWPDRLEGENLSANVLHIQLQLHGKGRKAVCTGTGNWPQRLEKLQQIAQFLARAGWQHGARKFLEGDASSRRYERLSLGNEKAVLMDMPARDDRHLLKNGKSYSETAKLAHSVTAVSAINQALRAHGFSAPKTIASDLENGLLLIEDLGDQIFGRMLRQGLDMREPMLAATELLAQLAQIDFTGPLPADEGQTHCLPDYDLQAFAAELDVYLDWYVPQALGHAPDDLWREKFHALWADLLRPCLAQKPVIVLRDYHSPNLIWLAQRQAIKRVGLIDTQDAVLGPATYDLASLLQDARVHIPSELSQICLDHYCHLRAKADPQFDAAQFTSQLWIISTQRLFKVLGIFVRLSRRDGKHGYLPLIAGLMTYLDQNLAREELSALREFLPAWKPTHD